VKIYIISDIHLVAPGATSKGMDSAQRLQWAFYDLATNHADAALCVLLGDLADHAEADAYRSLRSMIASVRTPVITLLGNHDDRATYLAETPEAETDADGFVQAVRDTPMGRLIFLDTAETGYVTGHLCAKRQAWLSARLDEAAGRPIYLFMHHPPFDIGAKVDQLKFKDGETLAAMIARHGQVRHIAAPYASDLRRHLARHRLQQSRLDHLQHRRAPDRHARLRRALRRERQCRRHAGER
jgi:3',5'-cyclic AMP phosphodiesterase CpdA